MMFSFEYGTRQITFDVEYRKRTTLEINIEPPNLVHVIAPLGTLDEDVLRKVKSRAKWIVQRLLDIRDMAYQPIQREMVNGEAFLYLGRNYSMQIVIDERKEYSVASLQNGKFVVTTPRNDPTAVHQAMEAWFIGKARERIKERVAYYQRKIPAQPSGIRIKDQKKRWGSCTKANELFFNWRSVMNPAPVLDYIVVHEMVHMIEKSHSQKFWDLVAMILPDFAVRKKWLRDNGVKMDI